MDTGTVMISRDDYKLIVKKGRLDGRPRVRKLQKFSYWFEQTRTGRRVHASARGIKALSEYLEAIHNERN